MALSRPTASSLGLRSRHGKATPGLYLYIARSLAFSPALFYVLSSLSHNAPVAGLSTVRPFPIDNFKRNVLVRRSSGKADNRKTRLVLERGELEVGRLRPVNEVWVEDVELVP